MKESNMPKADFVTSIGLIVFGVVVLAMALDMPRFEDQNVNPYSVPGIVPGFLGAIIAMLGLILLIRSIIRKGYMLDLSGSTFRAFFTAESTRRYGLTILLGVVYAFVLIGHMPYALATALFVFGFIFVFGYDRSRSLGSQKKIVLTALLIAVLTAAIVTAVFRYLFLINLPG